MYATLHIAAPKRNQAWFFDLNWFYAWTKWPFSEAGVVVFQCFVDWQFCRYFWHWTWQIAETMQFEGRSQRQAVLHARLQRIVEKSGSKEMAIFTVIQECKNQAEVRQLKLSTSFFEDSEEEKQQFNNVILSQFCPRANLLPWPKKSRQPRARGAGMWSLEHARVCVWLACCLNFFGQGSIILTGILASNRHLRHFFFFWPIFQLKTTFQLRNSGLSRVVHHALSLVNVNLQEG